MSETEGSNAATLAKIEEDSSHEDSNSTTESKGQVNVPDANTTAVAQAKEHSAVTSTPMTQTPTSSENTVDNEFVRNKKKELMRPLFSRTSTTDKTTKQTANKTMIVETETVDASSTPSVTLPIGSSANVISNDLMSTNSSISNNLASLRTRKSTLFVDQNNQSTANSNLISDDNDNASVNGSIRNFNKRLNQADSHLNIAKPGATKADLFAAKIANAVGDVSDSDSEETFVYESAPDALNSTNSHPINKSLGTSNPLALRKLSLRNVSMPVTSNVHPYSPSVSSHMAMVNDESKELINQNFDTENESDISTANGSQNQSNHPSQPQQIQPNTVQDKLYIMKSSLDPSSNDSNSTDSKSKFTKYRGDNDTPRKASAVSPRPSGQAPMQKSNAKNQLRTTTSKLFDVKGSSLRRYSGVPDDVNIEDYIDQYDEEQEIGADNYSDSYDYYDFEEDDELTPLNVNNANNNLRHKMSKHYFNRRSLSNFRSTDSGEFIHDYGSKTDENFAPGTKLKNKKYKVRSNQQQQRFQQAYSPHNFHNTKRNNKFQTFKNFLYFFVLVFLLLTFGFVAGFFLATTKDLQNVQITSVDNIVVSYDELIFDLSVRAFNPGFASVEITDIELDIFAKSSHVSTETIMPIYREGASSDVQTILLGSIVKFETPLVFTSGFFNRRHSLSQGEIKLLHPGQNSTDTGHHDDDGQNENHKIENDSDKWKTIMMHKFDLIIQGTFKYDLPFYHNGRSIAVTKTVEIDPE